MCTATATVADQGGQPLPGREVTIATADNEQRVGPVNDHGDGTYTATITSSRSADRVQVIATDGSASPPVQASARLTQTPLAEPQIPQREQKRLLEQHEGKRRRRLGRPAIAAAAIVAAAIAAGIVALLLPGSGSNSVHIQAPAHPVSNTNFNLAFAGTTAGSGAKTLEAFFDNHGCAASASAERLSTSLVPFRSGHQPLSWTLPQNGRYRRTDPGFSASGNQYICSYVLNGTATAARGTFFIAPRSTSVRIQAPASPVRNQTFAVTFTGTTVGSGAKTLEAFFDYQRCDISADAERFRTSLVPFHSGHQPYLYTLSPSEPFTKTGHLSVSASQYICAYVVNGFTTVARNSLYVAPR
jgi:hypothetical protein